MDNILENIIKTALRLAGAKAFPTPVVGYRPLTFQFLLKTLAHRDPIVSAYDVADTHKIQLIQNIKS